MRMRMIIRKQIAKYALFAGFSTIETSTYNNKNYKSIWSLSIPTRKMVATNYRMIEKTLHRKSYALPISI